MNNDLATKLSEGISYSQAMTVFLQFTKLDHRQDLAVDLGFCYGEDWHEQIFDSPAVQVYINRIREVSNTESTLLVSHSYIRDVGDLSGEQSLRNIICSTLELTLVEGTKFNEFDEIPNPEAKRDFKRKYRDALNSLPIDNELAQKIVDEANASFTLNHDVVHELKDNVTTTISDHVFELIVRQDRVDSLEHYHGHNYSTEITTAINQQFKPTS